MKVMLLIILIIVTYGNFIKTHLTMLVLTGRLYYIRLDISIIKQYLVTIIKTLNIVAFNILWNITLYTYLFLYNQRLDVRKKKIKK